MSADAARLTAALADRYRIERELGQGGMATVYLAEDLKHDRKVAIKVLHPELSAVIGAERFLAEIKLTAQLQHPHILGLIDSGAADGLLYYVMPFIDGETLRGRLTREKQLPVEDAVRLAREVAAALEYAHKRGIVHRDIKPENILLQDDAALVADFGIALAVQQAGGQRMTQTGLSLGTPAYMSPEQAMGEREITPRADVYALGAMTYEMLAGEPPFTGTSSQAIVARVLTEQPRSITAQRRTVPPHVEATVLRALEKLPADRFGSAAQFAEALVRPGMATVPMPAAARVPTAPRARARALLPWVVAALGLAAAAWGWLARPKEPPPRWQYLALRGAAPMDLSLPSLALAPDGSEFAFATANPAPYLLWHKRRGELLATPIPGTDGALYPSYSPDGQWLAFVSFGKVKKVRPDGGTVTTLADSASNGFGGLTWLDDGTVVYVGPTVSELSRVDGRGGTPTVVLRDSITAGLGLGSPTALPGARGVLFIGCNSGCVTIAFYVLDLRTGRVKRLLEDVAQGWYLPTGELLYVRRDGTAMLAPFDLDRLELAGPATPVLEGVYSSGGSVQFAWAPSGDVVYVQGARVGNVSTLVRVDRAGLAKTVDSGWSGAFNSFALSPNGRQVAVGVGLASGSLAIWVKQLGGGPFTRVSFGGQDRRPTWSPDGQQIAFIRDTLGTSVVFARRVDGVTPERQVAKLDRAVQEVAWSPDGTWLVLRTDNGLAGRGDLVGVRTTGDTTPVPLVASPYTELHPAISPDGRWLAYASDESGVNEVFVRPFPGTDGGRWQVSIGGGASPRWSRDGRELFFIEPKSGELVAASLRLAPAFEVLARRTLFRAAGSGFLLDDYHQFYDVLPDGKGFLFMRAANDDSTTANTAVVTAQNWFGWLRARRGK